MTSELRREIAHVLYVEFEQREPDNEPRGHWLHVADRILALTRHPAPLSEENVEVVARALWARLYDDPPLKWPGLTHPDAECIVEDARAAITALTTQESNRG